MFIYEDSQSLWRNRPHAADGTPPDGIFKADLRVRGHVRGRAKGGPVRAAVGWKKYYFLLSRPKSCFGMLC